MINVTEQSYIENWPEFVKIALGEEAYSSKVIFSIFLLLVFFASLVGNVLTCTVIYYDKTMHTATNYYLFNLAISDLLVTFAILFIIYQLLIQKSNLVEFSTGVMSCKFVLCIQFFFMTLLWNHGILVLTALSIERYIAICYPMMLKGTPVWRRVGKIIAVIWTIAILETVSLLWTLEVIDTNNSLICFFLLTPTARIITGTLALTTFIVPLTIMMFVYTMIAFKVNDNQKCNLGDTVYKNGFKRKNVNKLIALTVSFVICWLPCFLIRMIILATDVQNQTLQLWWFTVAHKIAMFNSWFTTVLNPLLFSVMSIKFRKALKMLWDTKVKKRFEAEKIQNTTTIHTAQHKTQKSTSCYLVVE